MRKVLLIGNPNAGKTTVFNALTGRNERVGNWHGVTVSSSIAPAKKNVDILIEDLPGAYSIKPFSPEERCTADALNGDYDLIINVVESSSLKKSLKLTKELLLLGKPVAVLLTMLDELEKEGGGIDKNKLSEFLGCPVEDGIKGAEKLLKTKAPPVKKRVGELPLGIFTPRKNNEWGIADRLLLNPFFGVAFFFIVMLSVFYLTFGKYGLGVICGAFFEDFTEKVLVVGVNALLKKIEASTFLIRFFTEGIIGGLSGVIAFLPQLCVMYLCLILLEQSGYLSRVASLFDGLLKRVGLSGMAVFPLLVGFGCTASGILASKSTESAKVQKRTVLALHFIPCSARAPVFAFICSAFFKGRFLIVALLYFFGIALSLLSAYVFSRADGGKIEPLVIELSRIRLPKLKDTLKQLNYYLKTFIIKVGTVLLIVSAVVWLLRSFSPSMRFLQEEEIESSILARIGEAISFLFLPIGAKGWQIPVAVLCGLIAKEGMVSALALSFPLGIENSISLQTALALTVFSAYYTPCVMAIASSKVQTNRRLSAFYGAFSFLVALLSAYLTYALCLLFDLYGFVVAGGIVVLGITVITILLIFAVKKYRGRIDDKIFDKPARTCCQINCGRGCSLFCGEKIAQAKRYKGKR